MNKLLLIFFIFFSSFAFADWIDEFIQKSDTHLTCIGNKVCDDNGCTKLPLRFSIHFSLNDKNNKEVMKCDEYGCNAMIRKRSAYSNIYFYHEEYDDWTAEYNLKSKEFIIYFEQSEQNVKDHRHHFFCEND